MKSWIVAIIVFLILGLLVVVLFVNILGGDSSNTGAPTAPTAQNEVNVIDPPVEVPPDKEVGIYIKNLRVASGNDNYQVVENAFGPTAFVYIDRSYLVATSPPILATAPYIQTADSEFSATDENFLSFDVPEQSAVYVMYDSNATSLPNWLASWTNTGEIITTLDDRTGVGVDFNVYIKIYSAGPVVLGGNNAIGAAGAKHNYFVVVIPNYDI